MNTEKKKDYYVEAHNQIIGWTENCDTKASVILAFIGVLVSVVFTSEYILGAIETQIKNIITYWHDGIGNFSILSTMMFISLFGFVAFMCLCCYYSILSLKANIRCADDSIIFFAKIALNTKEDYLEKVNKMTDEEFESDKLSQIHNCAVICDNKFKNYNKSIKYLSFGLLCFICFILFTIILKAI